MIAEIYPGIYILDIPLRNIPLKATNAYLIVGKKKNLLVDTGLNNKECLEAIQQGLEDAQVKLDKTDIFLTHMHSDHSGLVPRLSQTCNQVYAGIYTAEHVNNSLDWSALFNHAQLCGLPQKDLLEGRNNHPGYKYRPQGHVSFSLVQEKDILQYGEFSFHCLETPGHTKGHMCLYEPYHQLFLAGDHLLAGITPNISQWTEKNTPLLDFLQSLDKIAPLDVRYILPGHGEAFYHFQARIKEIFNHHLLRCREILKILDQQSMTPFHIASLMSWDLQNLTWEDFPFAQKWFATGEALSHLTFLEYFQLLRKSFDGSHYYYSITKPDQSSLESLTQIVHPYCPNIGLI